MRLRGVTWRTAVALALALALVSAGTLVYAGGRPSPELPGPRPLPLVSVVVPQQAAQALIDAGLDVVAVRPAAGG
ncbi:MAG: hypothetical protein K6T75_07610, partial [Acetobacteraceae bacterium]|nr:hypothetical protein [Acetobacteraceae bacterium]